MEVSGKYVIIFIFGTALVAAMAAWTFQYQRGRRVLALWGADNARLMRVDAEHIELLLLKPSAEADGSLEVSDAPREIEIDGTQYATSKSKDIIQARGLIHARQALIEDGSFNWEKQRGDCQPRWQYALRFTANDRVATVAFDTNCQRVRLLETGSEAAIIPKIFEGWMTFLKEQETSK